MIQQILIDFLGRDIAVLLAIFIGVWALIYTFFGIFGIIRFFDENDKSF
jgi:hypothetical protein